MSLLGRHTFRWVAGAAVVLVGASVPLVRAVMAQSGQVTSSDWSSFLDGPLHGSYNASATSITPSDAASLKAVWSFKPPASTSAGAPYSGFQSSPTVADGMVFIGSNTGVFYAFNESMGKLIWSRSLGFSPELTCPAQGFVSTATVGEGPSGVLTVYVAAPTGYLYAMNAETGAVIWRSVVGQLPSTTVNDYFNYGSPTVANGTVYMGISSDCDDPLVYAGLQAFDQATGQLLATYHTVPQGETGASIWGSVLVAPDGSVLAGTGNDPGKQTYGNSTSIIELNGTTLDWEDGWQAPQKYPDEDFGASPTYWTVPGTNTAMVGICSKNGHYYAFDLSDLSAGPAWIDPIAFPYPSNPDGGQCDGAAVFNGTDLFVGGPNTTFGGKDYAGGVFELNPSNGKILWFTGLTGQVIGSPTLDGGGVLAVPTMYGGNSVVLLNAANGDRITQIDAYAAEFAQPVFAGSHLFVAGRSLTAYSVG